MGDGGVDGQPGREVERVPVAELGELALSGHEVAAGRGVVSHHGPVGRVVLPVGGRQLEELDGVGLDIYAYN